MTLSPEIQDGMKAYLWDVAAHLSALSREARTDILRDVESHIHEALSRRGAEPTLEDWQAVLADMPEPASYAAEPAAPREPVAGERLTWKALWDSVWVTGQMGRW